ncbi:uncharacterized protein LOC119073607 [Bradysia coprophila]|uniref:uncharacterized protein LOC119073607 n=1 Tax=Bradysia coprophila TaxID=38358 RepID=UPI00187DA938|nr:uncharacterized protein LOC119073607 [Bradysia coprophila]XP_037035077.1 uncharacterized protein LOC119073607 [Bradysia coprophila]
MANTLSPLSKSEVDDLFSEIKSLVEAECQDEPKPNVEIQDIDVLPTRDNFDKSELLQCLRILEPNAVIFFQDLQKLLQVYLCENAQSFPSEDVEYLKYKYLIGGNKSITLRRIAALFPSLTCNLLKCSTHIPRPISQQCLSHKENYPRQMTTRCIFSLIPLTPLIGKLQLIEAALLYQILEQAKFNTIKTENGQVNYDAHMKISLDYCLEDYMSEFETNEKRIKQFDELELYIYGHPIPPIYDAVEKFKEIVGNSWDNEIISKFKLIKIEWGD